MKTSFTAMEENFADRAYSLDRSVPFCMLPLKELRTSQPSIMRFSTGAFAETMSSKNSSSSSMLNSARKPSLPRLTPITGTFALAKFLAAEMMLPSPPKTIAKLQSLSALAVQSSIRPLATMRALS